MLIQDQPGTPQNIQDYAQNTVRGDRQGALLTSEGGHGMLYQTALAGNLFSAANQTAIKISGIAMQSSTLMAYSGLCLSNPVNSSVNVSVMGAGISLTAVEVGCSGFFLATGGSSTDPYHTTSIPAQSSRVGLGLIPKAVVDSACDLNTQPNYFMPFNNMASPTAGAAPPFMPLRLDGSLVLPPGGYVIFAGSPGANGQAQPVGFTFHFLWEEIPI